MTPQTKLSRSKTATTIGAVVVTLALVAACGGGSKKKSTPPTPTPTPTLTTPSPTSTPTTPAAKLVNPFTGGKPSTNAVVAVKIDDTASGRPQVGIDKADVVYIEQVEGGLTRLLAIYNTSLPTVEAVRSTRASDPELVEQYGPIAYVASGGAPNPLQVLDKSTLKSSINDRGGPGFARDGGRPVPYNLTANLALAAKALHAPKAKDIGLTFSAGTTQLKNALVRTSISTVVGGTPVNFVYNASIKQYVRVIDGVQQHTADGALVATPNVIVQFCTVSPYPADLDVLGNPSQFTYTVGSGRAVVYRNGHAVDGTWTRSAAKYGTKFLDKYGHKIPLAPGGEWIVLVAKGSPLH